MCLLQSLGLAVTEHTLGDWTVKTAENLVA